MKKLLVDLFESVDAFLELNVVRRKLSLRSIRLSYGLYILQ